MTDDSDEVAELQRLLGPLTYPPPPPDLDDLVLRQARMILQPPRPLPPRAGPSPIAWVVVGTAAVAVTTASWWPPNLTLPPSLPPVAWIAVIGYLLTLLTTPLILVRRPPGGIDHGQPR